MTPGAPETEVPLVQVPPVLGAEDDEPDDVEVDPGHTGGSLCGAGLSRDKVSTIGMQRLSNEALRIADLQEFVAHSAAISAPRPPTVERVVALVRPDQVEEPVGQRRGEAAHEPGVGVGGDVEGHGVNIDPAEPVCVRNVGCFSIPPRPCQARFTR